MTEKPSPPADRKNLSFEQAEGIAPLPSQLKRGEISKEFRAILWANLHKIFEAHRIDHMDAAELANPWEQILRDVHVFRDHLAVDDFLPPKAAAKVTERRGT